MALGKLFGKLFKEPEDGPSVEEIDAEVEAAVRDIQSGPSADVGGNDVLATGWGEPGDMVYIMELAHIYVALGTRTGRTVANLRESCREVFNKYVKFGLGQTSFVGDNFFMRFYDLGDSEGFHRAAVITNEVCENILGDRFERLEVPEYVIAAEAQDVTNSDGSLNVEKSEAAVRSGGAEVDKTPKQRVRSVKVAFYPTWTPATEVIETYNCYVRQRTPKGLIYGKDVYPKSPTDPLSILIDGKKTKLAARDIETLAHFNMDLDLILPLRFATLRSRQAAGIAKLLNDASPVWRQQHLIFEIFDIPEKATDAHLAPLVDWATANGRCAALRCAPDNPQFDRTVASGAEFACFDYADTKAVNPDYKALADQAREAGLRSALWSITDHNEIERLIAAGFDLMNGTAVAEPMGAIGKRKELRNAEVVLSY